MTVSRCHDIKILILSYKNSCPRKSYQPRIRHSLERTPTEVSSHLYNQAKCT